MFPSETKIEHFLYHLVMLMNSSHNIRSVSVFLTSFFLLVLSTLVEIREHTENLYLRLALFGVTNLTTFVCKYNSLRSTHFVTNHSGKKILESH